MRCNEIATAVLIIYALIGWGVGTIGNKIVSSGKEEIVQVCEQIDEKTTVCRTMGIGSVTIEPLAEEGTQ